MGTSLPHEASPCPAAVGCSCTTSGWSRRWRSADITSAHPSRTARCTRIVGLRVSSPAARPRASDRSLARGTFFLENYEDLPALTPRTSALALLQARQGVRHVRRRAHRMSLVPRHRPRRARGVRLHLRRQGAFVLARRLLSPRLLPRRHHAVLHEGRAQDPPGPLRDQHHPSLPLVQELAREPVPVVRVSRPIPAVQRVHHSARGPPQHGSRATGYASTAASPTCSSSRASHATAPSASSTAARPTPRISWWCAPSTAPGRTSDRASTSPCGGRFSRQAVQTQGALRTRPKGRAHVGR